MLMDIIQYLLSVIQYLYQQNCWLITFICKYIPLKQWAFDDSHSPKYQKLKTDELPKMEIHHNDWDWQLLIPYYEFKYHKKIKPVSISMEDLDALLYQLLKRRSLTNNEAVILHLTFESLYRRIDDEGTRLLVISDILKNLNLH